MTVRHQRLTLAKRLAMIAHQQPESEMVTASEMGKKGGQAKSEAKASAARKNASKPRGRWVTAIAYGVVGKDDKLHVGHLLFLKNFDMDFGRNGPAIEAAITADLRWCADAALPFKRIDYFSGSARKRP